MDSNWCLFGEIVMVIKKNQSNLMLAWNFPLHLLQVLFSPNYNSLTIINPVECSLFLGSWVVSCAVLAENTWWRGCNCGLFWICNVFFCLWLRWFHRISVILYITILWGWGDLHFVLTQIPAGCTKHVLHAELWSGAWLISMPFHKSRLLVLPCRYCYMLLVSVLS